MDNHRTITMQELIPIKIREKRISRAELIRAMGYSNVNKGLRRLETYLAGLKAPGDEFVNSLLAALDIDGPTFYRAMNASFKVIENNAARHFRPYLTIGIDFQPQPFFAAQIILRRRTIPVPAHLQELQFSREIAAVCALYRESIARLSFKERATGFTYQRRHNYRLIFSTDLRLQDARVIHHALEQPALFGNRVLDSLLP